MLTGGSGNDTISGNADANILGGAGDEVLRAVWELISSTVEPVLTDLLSSGYGHHINRCRSLTVGLEGDDTLFAIEQATLTGGAGANSLNASSFSGSAILAGEEGDDTFIVDVGAYAINGGAGNDTLVAGDRENTWEITAEDLGLLNGNAFDSIENLIGGAVADNFMLAAGAMITGMIDGRQGEDRFKSE
jgi:Ca2+-binding RTX toxin-like protein